MCCCAKPQSTMVWYYGRLYYYSMSYVSLWLVMYFSYVNKNRICSFIAVKKSGMKSKTVSNSISGDLFNIGDDGSPTKEELQNT